MIELAGQVSRIVCSKTRKSQEKRFAVPIRSALLAGAFLAIYSPVAFAQDADKHSVGIVIAYPSSVGAVFEMSPHIAIRPDLLVSGSSLTEAGQTVSTRSIAVGLDLLIFLRRYDRVRTYVAPRVSYTRNTDTESFAHDVLGVAGSYGVEYAPTAHVSVFGEVGLFVGHQLVKPSGGFTSWTTRAGVGFVFYP